ncbi:isopentenyl-diphosphate delta-isomerase idi1 [Chamberlinius hualienensis]
MLCTTFRKIRFLTTGISKLSKLNSNYVNSSQLANLMAGHDPQQVTLLDEQCIAVDEMDKVLGQTSKKDCHLFINQKKGILHRAFSVFLFNSQGDLLLQRRSKVKITFPGYYSNTCCSHPLHNPEELDETDTVGVKKAAQRRLQIELGIPTHQIPLDKFEYLTRIHYCAPADAPWGEHEMDYILFIKADVNLNINLNEVAEHRYISRQQLSTFIDSLNRSGISVTPWFKLIIQHYLPYWWKHLDNIEAIKDQGTIHRL